MSTGVAWPEIKAAIVAFARACNVIADDVQIHWDEQAKPHMHGDYLWLTIRDEKSIGWDDVEDVEVTDANGKHWYPRVTGLREFVVEFEYRSRSAAADKAARNALEVIRSSLMHPVRRAILDDAGVAFLGAEDIRTEPNNQHDSRKESIAVLPVQFRVLATLFPVAVPEQGPRLAAIELALTVKHEGPDILTTISEGG
jgi:hypothetical protein